MFTKEPVRTAGAIVGAVQSILAALVLLGAIHLSGEQVAGIVTAVNAVLGVPLVLVARSAVTPNVNVLTERAGSSERKPPKLIGGPVQLTQPWPDNETGR